MAHRGSGSVNGVGVDNQYFYLSTEVTRESGFPFTPGDDLVAHLIPHVGVFLTPASENGDENESNPRPETETEPESDPELTLADLVALLDDGPFADPTAIPGIVRAADCEAVEIDDDTLLIDPCQTNL